MEVDDALELAKKYRKMTGENPRMKKDQGSFERDVDFLQGRAPKKPDLTKAAGVALKIKR
tara:strand:- start:263 stop:442 length:180 start_codon:yes stop_codon:yes gene_type:complete